MTVKNMKNANGNKAVNQFIITEGSKVTFQSYDSKIAEFDTEQRTLILYPHWDYSKTTMKFLKQFIEDETTFDYGTKKDFEKRIASHDRITVKGSY